MGFRVPEITTPLEGYLWLVGQMLKLLNVLDKQKSECLF